MRQLPTQLPRVLPGPAPAAVRARVLRTQRFAQVLRQAAELLRQALAGEGYGVGDWKELPAAETNSDWTAPLRDSTRDEPLEFRVWANVSPLGCVSLNAQVVDPAQPEVPGVLVRIMETANLPNASEIADIELRLTEEVESRAAFIEPTTQGGTLRAIRVAKQFHRPESWAADAAQVLLEALDPR